MTFVDRKSFRDEAEKDIAGACECQKELLGRRASPRAVNDGDLQVPQGVPVAHKQIDVLYRIFDSQNTRPRGRKQNDPVMGVVKA
jgi:hypothetical protein